MLKLKILLMGDPSTGKGGLITKFLSGFFVGE